MQRAQRGFTLIEMLVVLVIIGLLAGLIGPRLFSQADKSKVKTAKVQIKMLKNSLQTLELDYGRFPNNHEGLSLLVQPPSNPSLAKRWHGPYLGDPKVPKDPWGYAYHYQVPGPKNMPFALWSDGADGKPGGKGINADIGYLPPGRS
ncbi:type II secretion system major pseudopilin GspG [Salinisphaera sp. RV14]|uniref:type II secretion system major pseudopilin GspG n=1 Tax=unclassified Salinisphaera TaxID=2649847 RepID=UPI003F83E00D